MPEIQQALIKHFRELICFRPGKEQGGEPDSVEKRSGPVDAGMTSTGSTLPGKRKATSGKLFLWNSDPGFIRETT